MCHSLQKHSRLIPLITQLFFFSFGSFLALLVVSSSLVEMLLVSIGLVVIEAKVFEVQRWATKLAEHMLKHSWYFGVFL